MIEHTGETLPVEVHWLLVGSIAITLISIAFLMQTIRISKEHQHIYHIGGIFKFISGIIILLLGFTSLGPIPILIIMMLLMPLPVFYYSKALIHVTGVGEV